MQKYQPRIWIQEIASSSKIPLPVQPTPSTSQNTIECCRSPLLKSPVPTTMQCKYSPSELPTSTALFNYHSTNRPQCNSHATKKWVNINHYSLEAVFPDPDTTSSDIKSRESDNNVATLQEWHQRDEIDEFPSGDVNLLSHKTQNLQEKHSNEEYDNRRTRGGNAQSKRSLRLSDDELYKLVDRASAQLITFPETSFMTVTAYQNQQVTFDHGYR